MSATLALKNIQGDILSGLPKKTQFYTFFQINNVTRFRQHLMRFIPLIKTVDQVLEDRKAIEEHKRKRLPGLVPMVGVNISFSHTAFVKMGIDDSSLGRNATDPYFKGQKVDAIENLADPRKADNATLDWDDHFLQNLDGVILISGDCHATIVKKKAEIDLIFNANTRLSSIKEIITIRGDVRPGNQSAHEHFGFLDGVSNPVVNGFDTVINPGPKTVEPGVVVTGHTGDPESTKRAAWAVDGSFLAFRWLFQEVPEFNEFLKKNPIAKDGNGKVLTPEQGSELLGARMVGRWKSGAPIDIAPFQDDTALGTDPKRNNDFRFQGEGTSQLHCPFAAHVRKTNPRDDLEAHVPSIPVEGNRIMRRGVQFGPEVTAEENASGKTQHGRGLLFTCYQSSLINGFQLLQHQWANNAAFQPFTGKSFQPGLDPLIGQGKRGMPGLDPLDEAKIIPMEAFIIPKGGEYFFAPSINGLKSTIAKEYLVTPYFAL